MLDDDFKLEVIDRLARLESKLEPHIKHHWAITITIITVSLIAMVEAVILFVSN